MSYTLVIAEKRNLALDIARALNIRTDSATGYVDGGKIRISWASGHLLQQADAHEYDPKYRYWEIRDLPVCPDKFLMVVKRDTKTKNTDANAQRQIGVLASLLKGAANVVNAGDPDREGQIIVDELLTYLGNRLPTKRLWLHAQTNEGIQDAWRSMKDNQEWLPLSHAAQCRSELDWLIGINCTRGYTKLWQEKQNVGVLNVGRVKSPTIGLVVLRELEIRNFKPTDFFFVRAQCVHPNGQFLAKWVPQAKEPPDFDESGRLINKARAEQVIAATKGKQGKVKSVVSVPKKNGPPLLLSLGELQKIANKMGLSPDRTLECAQSLYNEYKLTTYPRTTCRYAPVVEHAKAPGILAAVRQNYGDKFPYGHKETNPAVKSATWNDSKLEAHFAIMPTNERRTVASLPRDEALVYGIIVQHYCAQFMPWYEYTTTTVTVDCNNHDFQAQGSTPTKLGWREIFGGAPIEKDADDEPVQPMPVVKMGDMVNISKVYLDAQKTSPPSRYTEGTLLDAMENAHRYVTDPKVKKTIKDVGGIGTAATQGETIKSIIREGFVGLEKKGKNEYLFPTPKANAYYQAIPAQLAKVDFTAWFEDRLTAVAKREMSPEVFRQNAAAFVHKLVEGMRDGSVLAKMPTALVTEKEPYRAPASKASKGKGSRAAPRKTAGRGPARAGSR